VPEGNEKAKPKRQRQRVFPIRLTDAEHAALVSRAERAGLSVAGLIRLQCLDQPPPRAARRPSVELAAVARLLAQVGKVGGNVNQIAHALNAGGAPESMVLTHAAAMSDIAEMKTAIMEALGLDGH
jgi:hypothetical protein